MPDLYTAFFEYTDLVTFELDFHLKYFSWLKVDVIISYDIDYLSEGKSNVRFLLKLSSTKTDVCNVLS